MKIVKSNSIEKKEKIEPFIFIKSGLSPKQANPVSFFMENHFPYIKVGTLNDNNKIIKKNNFFSNSNKNKINNAVIFPKRGAAIFTNKVAIIKEDSFIDTNLMAISSEKINLDYLYYYLKWYKLSRIADTGAIPQLNNKHINNLKIPILKKEEQEKIAQVLSQQEEQVNNIQKLIEKLEKRNQYYAERLLSGELRVREDEEGNIEFYENKDWKEVRLNGIKTNIPLDWDLKKVEDISTLINGFAFKKADMLNEGKYPIIKMNNFKNGKITLNDLTKYTNKVKPTAKLLKGDLVMGLSGSVGSTALFELSTPCFLNQRCLIIRSKNNNLFIKNCLTELILNFIKKEAQGGVIANLSHKDVANFDICYSDNHFLISKIINDLFEQKNELINLLKKEQKRFEWLSDALLSGEYQIVD